MGGLHGNVDQEFDGGRPSSARWGVTNKRRDVGLQCALDGHTMNSQGIRFSAESVLDPEIL